MSMMGTLAKVALGVAVAKGVGSLMNRSGGASSGGGGLGGLMEQLGGARQSGGAASGGGLGDLLGGLAGGGGQSGGGLGGLLGGLAGGAAGGASGGGLGDLLGQLAGNAPQQREQGGTFGELLNEAVANEGEPSVAPSASEEVAAALMLKAMVQAAKSDGRLDEREKARLLENLEGASDAEREFVNRELAGPVDVQGLAQQVPAGLEEQVYAMSVMGIDLDHQAEAQYLHELASALNIGQQDVNAIHDQMGAQRIYS